MKSTGTHRQIIGLPLFFCVCLGILFTAGTGATEQSANDYPKKVLSLRWTAYPWVPAMSEVRYRNRFSTESGNKFWDHLELETWYMASSVYFYPKPFAEIGIKFSYIIPIAQRWEIGLGIGTGIASETVKGFFDGSGTGDWSVPLIVQISGLYKPNVKWLSVGARIEGLVYGEGFLIDSLFPVYFGPFGPGIMFEIGPGFNYGMSTRYSQTAYAIKLFYGIAWAF